MGSMLFSSGSTVYDQHFLQSCSLCSKTLGYKSDIYMYRGDTPFCSKECRQEQIDMDTAKERSTRMKKKMGSSSSSSSKNVRSGTVAVA